MTLQTTSSRIIRHSFFFQILFLPRRVLHNFLQKHRTFFLALKEGSYFHFFLRHPERIRLKDYGLLLLSFELSFFTSLFMQGALSPLRRNFSFFFFVLSLLLIGPLDRLQKRKRRKVVSLPSLFSYIVGAMIVGFLGSLISPPLFTSILLCIGGIVLFLYQEVYGLCFTLLLYPIIGMPITIELLLIGILIRVVRRALDGKALPSVSVSLIPMCLLFAVLFCIALLWAPALFHVLPLLLAYPLSFSANSFSGRTLLLSAAILLVVLTFFYPTTLSGTLVLLSAIFLGIFGEKGTKAL